MTEITSKDSPARREVSPWAFVPTMYFAEGVPYILINSVSVIMYKKMGVENADIARYTSLLYLPWVIKMFWGPLVDMVSTKRTWVLVTQILLTISFGVVAMSLGIEAFFWYSMAAFAAGAFVSATHDIATDGFYMLSMHKDRQAYFVGIRTTAYRFAMIFGSGLLVYVAGKLEGLATPAAEPDFTTRTLSSLVNSLGLTPGNIAQSWQLIFSSVSLLFLMISVYHLLMLPRPAGDRPSQAAGSEAATEFGKALSSYFKQPNVAATLAFILLFRFGEAMLIKLTSPFLLDPVEKGGMGLKTEVVGVAYGTIGLIAMIVGGILGGITIARLGFRRSIWGMALATNMPNAFYIFMAWAQPGVSLVYALVAIEQFGQGFGFTAFTVYLMYVSQGVYKTSHFAISTGIMALGMMLPGAISGDLQTMLAKSDPAHGYLNFFIVVFILTFPGFFTIPFILRSPQIDDSKLPEEDPLASP